MSLKDIPLKDNYDSDNDNLLEDLLKPCLRESSNYFRSVGFLDHKLISLLAHEFDEFAKNGGEARLLIGRVIDVKDYLAIKEGSTNPERFLAIPDLETLWEEFSNDSLERRRLLVLSWLIARSVITVKFSLRPKGIHHDKFAYFSDFESNEIVVHGTNNETHAANLPDLNYESLTVFKNWDSEVFGRFGEYKLREFLKLWDGKSRGSIAVSPPSEILEKIAHLSESKLQDNEYGELFEQLETAQRETNDLPSIPTFWGQERYKLKQHQKSAINSFFKNREYKAVFAMATGSGKTITALHAVTLLSRDLAITNRTDILVVVGVPYQVLADQWVDNARSFGFEPIRAYGSIDNWIARLNLVVDLSRFRKKARVTCVVAVNNTLQSAAFLSLMSYFESDQVIFIADECHKLISAINGKTLPNSSYRLALSATPWASSEVDRRRTLLNYFGRALFTYSLEDAFRDDVLVPYRYVSLIVNLSDEESEAYSVHTLAIKQLIAIRENGGDIDENNLRYHFYMRASVLGSATEKYALLPGLFSQAEKEVGKNHLLVYCGSGSTEDDLGLGNDQVRDIDRAQYVASQSGVYSSRITAREPAAIRKSILQAFEKGEIAAVFAIQVLDEGFDMPGIRGAILLASSKNERQFIQRRGRVLRRVPGKEIAVIWDFLVTGIGFLNQNYEAELARSELFRSIEFARLADNWADLESILREHAEQRDLDFDQIYEDVITNVYEGVNDDSKR